MDKINRDNYEAFFLDYIDGNLNPEQSEELFQFLEAYPEFKEEFYSFENITLEKEPILFSDKNYLIKPEITHKNYENFIIAAAEGDISDNEKRALDSFLKLHPEYTRDKEIFLQLRSTPDESVYFEFKENLKKEEQKPVGKIIYLYRSIAVAASVVLATFIFIQINNSNKDSSIAYVGIKKQQELKVENNTEVENQKNSTALLEPEEVKDITEQKINLKKESNNNKPVVEERHELQVAYTTLEKIEPVIKSEAEKHLPEAQDYQIAEVPETPVRKEETEHHNRAQAAINTVEQLIRDDMKFNEASVASNVVDLATAGINKITGKELVSFEKQYNEESNRKKIQISAGNFGFSRSTSR